MPSYAQLRLIFSNGQNLVSLTINTFKRPLFIISQKYLYYKCFDKFYKYVYFSVRFLLEYPKRYVFFCYNHRFSNAVTVNFTFSVVILSKKVYNNI